MPFHSLGRTWSLILAGACVLRAASYLVRTPVRTPYTDLVAGSLGYPAWSVLLSVSALLIVAGVATSHVPLLVLGHVLAFGCHVIFTLSLTVAAVWFGQPWAGLDALLVVTVLHCVAALMVRPSGDC